MQFQNVNAIFIANLNAVVIAKISELKCNYYYENYCEYSKYYGYYPSYRIETWELLLLTKGFTQILLEYAQIVVESVFSRI